LLVELGVRSATSCLRNAACTRGPRCAPASIKNNPLEIWPPYLINSAMMFVFQLALDGAAALSLPPVAGVLAGPSFATRSVLLRSHRCWPTTKSRKYSCCPSACANCSQHVQRLLQAKEFVLGRDQGGGDLPSLPLAVDPPRGAPALAARALDSACAADLAEAPAGGVGGCLPQSRGLGECGAECLGLGLRL
jgi:hypothetical protein